MNVGGANMNNRTNIPDLIKLGRKKKNHLNILIHLPLLSAQGHKEGQDDLYSYRHDFPPRWTITTANHGPFSLHWFYQVFHYRHKKNDEYGLLVSPVITSDKSGRSEL